MTPTLTPAHLTLIRVLAEAAVERGYLTPDPAPQQDPGQERTERALPPAERAA